jgi:hypothetical protein
LIKRPVNDLKRKVTMVLDCGLDNLSYDSISKEGRKEGRTRLSSKMVEEEHKAV